MSIHVRKGRLGTSYQVRYRRPDTSQASRTFRTKKDAERFEAEIVLEQGDVREVTRQQRKITFTQVAEDWVRSREHRHSDKTKRRRDQILRLHLLPELGTTPIRSIKPSHIRELVYRWQKAGLSPLTIRNHIATARPIFKMAIHDGLIVKDPTTALELDSSPLRPTRVLTQQQCQTLLEALDDHHRRIFYTLLATGLRISELINLKIGDVDFEERLLRVSTSKTTTGIREIDLSPNDLTLLQQQILSLSEFGTEPHQRLFRSLNGHDLHYRNLAQRVLRTAIKKSGLPKFSFHDLRRTHATMLVAAGVDPKVVQQRMGHSSIETTLKYYAQATKQRREGAAHVAVNFLGGEETASRTQVAAKRDLSAKKLPPNETDKKTASST